MKTIAKLLCVIACTLFTSGCEDEPVYPSPPIPKKYPEYPMKPLFVAIKVPFNPEFDAKFTKRTCYQDDPILDELKWDIIYLWSLDKDQPVYVLNVEGDGTDPSMGEFTFEMSTIWSTEDLNFSKARITTENNGSFYVFLDNNKSILTPEYPYDQIRFENIFRIESTQGNSGIITGDGLVSFTVSGTFPNVMTLKWNGTLDIVISG